MMVDEKEQRPSESALLATQRLVLRDDDKLLALARFQLHVEVVAVHAQAEDAELIASLSLEPVMAGVAAYTTFQSTHCLSVLACKEP
jgi:hypothetical protein